MRISENLDNFKAALQEAGLSVNGEVEGDALDSPICAVAAQALSPLHEDGLLNDLRGRLKNLGFDQFRISIVEPGKFQIDDMTAFNEGLNRWAQEEGGQAQDAAIRIRHSFVSNSKELDLSRLELKTLPSELGRLSSLITLSLHGNRLTHLPDAICNLKDLIRLDLSLNSLTELPEDFGNLTHITQLNFYKQKLARLPDSFGNLTALTRLDLSENQLTQLPQSIGNLAALLQFNLSENELRELPQTIGNLTALEDLNLSHNKLTLLPNSLFNLVNLIEIDARNKYPFTG